jgi:hypothetical protein
MLGKKTVARELKGRAMGLAKLREHMSRIDQETTIRLRMVLKGKTRWRAESSALFSLRIPVQTYHKLSPCTRHIRKSAANEQKVGFDEH